MFFSKFDVNRIEWLNLIFENRNQSYGAYQLRLKSSQYLRNALLWSASVLTAVIVTPAVIHLIKGEEATVVTSMAHSLEKEDDERIRVVHIELEPMKKTETAGSQSAAAAKPQVTQIKYTAAKVSRTATETIPTVEDIKKAAISQVNQTGPESIHLNLPPGAINPDGTANGTGNGTGTGSGAGEGSGNEPVKYVEMMPEFPGGMEAWGRYLQKNLRYPALAIENNVAGKVTVSFVVEKNGQLTNIKVLRGIGAGCDEEAVRVIKNAPFWKPGSQNGKPVRVAYTVPILFQLNYLTKKGAE